MEKYALLFPGQGSQYIGMGKNLCVQYPIAKEVFVEANDVLGFDIMKLCFEGNSFELNRVENALPAILITSVAAFKAFMADIGVKPCISAGHSLGEYTALTCSGALSFADTLKIVRLRSKLASEVSKSLNGAMTVVNGTDIDTVEKACTEMSDGINIASIACYNSQSQFVVSGHQQVVMKVEDVLLEKNAQITPILMSPPFHCMLMNSVKEELKAELAKISFNPTMWPVLSNVSVTQYVDKEDIIENLSSQVIRPVYWRDILSKIVGMGIDTFIEVGPQAVLKELTSKNFNDARVFSYTQMNDKEKIINMFKSWSGNKIGRSYEITLVTKCLAAAVSTRNSNWNNDEYEKGIVIPFREIQDMQIKLQKENMLPSTEQMYKALTMLKSVLDTKKTSKEKQISIFNKILNTSGTYDQFKDFVEI